MPIKRQLILFLCTLASRNEIFGFDRARNDSCSSFFAPKPQRNACYAGYVHLEGAIMSRNFNEITKIYSLGSLDLEGCSSLKLFSEARWSLNPLFPLLKELGPADVGVSLKKTKNTIGYFRFPRASVSKGGWVVSLWYGNDFSFSCK